MPLLQQMFARLSAGHEDLQIRHRLARVLRKPTPAPAPPTIDRVIEALEEDCAEPLYDRSVYASTPQDPTAL
jgi:hypothetical protein